MTDWRPWVKASSSAPSERAILQAAALLHDVGRSKDEKGHHKSLLSDDSPPPASAGLARPGFAHRRIVARYHRGALPRAGQKPLRGLSPGKGKT